ncbi:MAG: ABC transporter ATP-binding protein [Candidatus Muirbacterium halophilum]|nr:ABC transporter ATP-binding protein [Candidatus Muirbacterium halophilum]MCK9477454.1 ABC transporter ATP-binding protein [Candidatus Muirbacterium halophilum]
MKINKIFNSIYHLKFKTQYNLCSTFLRFQEHYESPEFRGKIFTLKQYKNWYIKNSPGGKKTGKFTYYKDWSGFNIPSNIFDLFLKGKFNPLSNKEKKFINIIQNIKEKNFYIIGTFGKNDTSTLKHEIAHGLFYTEKSYREKVITIINSLCKTDTEKIINYFKNSTGYHCEIFNDELNSYILCDLDLLNKKGIYSENLIEKQKELQKEFENTTKGFL